MGIDKDTIVCTYKNFCLTEEREYEEDNVKNFHLVYEDEKYIGMMPYSPYSTPPGAVFKMWIDCGMPSSFEMDGQSDKSIHRYYTQWLDRQIDKLLVEEMTDAL
jgi:hypothetical protein